MKYAYGTLMHYGILGMKWGVRRYQNADGSYTAAGKARRNGKSDTASKKTKSSKPARPKKTTAERVAERAAKEKLKTLQLEEKAKRAEAKTRIKTAREAEKREEYASRIKAAEAKKSERLAEKKVNELPEKQVSAGLAYTNEILGSIGKKVLVTAVSGAALYLTAQAIGTKMDGGLKGAFKKPEFWKDFGSAVFNGGPKKK